MSAWWLCTLVPAFFAGYLLGWGRSWLKWRDTIKWLATSTQRLLNAGDIDRAVRLLKTAQGVNVPEEKVQFDAALKALGLEEDKR